LASLPSFQDAYQIVAGYVLDWYILIRKDVGFLCLSQNPKLYGTSMSEKTRSKSNQSGFANRLANYRRKHMNLLERLIDTKAAFSPLSDRLQSSKKATTSIS